MGLAVYVSEDSRQPCQASECPADPRKVRPLLIFAFTVERMADGSRKVDKIKSHVVQGPGFVRNRVARRQATGPSSWSTAMTGSSQATRAEHRLRWAADAAAATAQTISNVPHALNSSRRCNGPTR